MRYLCFLLLVTLFGLPLWASQDDEAVLPFAYVTWEGDTNLLVGSYDLHVMDAASGEMLYEIATDRNDCPVSISPNHRWLAYAYDDGSPSARDFFLLDFATGENIPMPAHRFGNVLWSADSRYFSYQSRDEEWNSSLVLYDTEIRETILVEAEQSLQWIFQGNDLLYLLQEENELFLYRWSNGERDVVSRLDNKNYELEYAPISPNGRFISMTNKKSLYVYDSESNSYELVADLMARRSSYSVWIPSPNGDLLAYLGNNGGVYLYDTASKTSRQIADRPLSWFRGLAPSPDGSYLATLIYTEGGTFNEANAIRLVQLDTDESYGVQSRINTWAGSIDWVASNQLVYNYASSEVFRENADLYLYDAELQENIRLTDTSELDEQFGCMWG